MKNKEALNPPKRKPTAEAILVAKARIAYEQEIWHMMECLIRYYHTKEGLPISGSNIYTPEVIMKDALKSSKKWNDKISNWVDGEMWEPFVDDAYFQRNYLNSLNYAHDGDCVGIPSSCERCDAESFLNIPTTVTWKPKHGEYILNNPEEEFDVNFNN